MRLEPGDAGGGYAAKELYEPRIKPGGHGEPPARLEKRSALSADEVVDFLHSPALLDASTQARRSFPALK